MSVEEAVRDPYKKNPNLQKYLEYIWAYGNLCNF